MDTTIDGNSRSKIALVNALMTSALLIGTAGEAMADGGPCAATAAPVLTLEEAACLLRAAPSDVLMMAQRGDLPGRLVAKHWRFARLAVLAWLAGEDAVTASMREGEPMTRPALALAKGRGTDPEAVAPGKETQPEAIGEKPAVATAEDIFLRDQAILLKPRELTVELGFSYGRSERLLLVPFASPFGVTSEMGEQKQDSYTTSLGLRYGLPHDAQLFGGIASVRRSDKLAMGGETLSKSNSGEWSALTLGLRKNIVQEKMGQPNVIVSGQVGIPIEDGPYAAGASVALTKSLDPAILFANLAYQHNFIRDSDVLTPSSAFATTFGLAYALNDSLSLSASVNGNFSGRTTVGGATLPAEQRYRLQLGMTAYLGKGLYIEPTVAFSLNGSGSDTTFGVSLPYTF